MRDIIRRLIRLIRIRWREYRRPAESLESIARRRIAATEWKTQMELAAFAFEMAPYPHPQKLICAAPPKVEVVRITEWVPASQFVKVGPCPWEFDIRQFVYGPSFWYGMTAYEIAIKIGGSYRAEHVEKAMAVLMAADDHLRTGNNGSERAYYFKK